MNIKCFRLNEMRCLEPVTTEVITARPSDDASNYWMDIESSTDPEALRELLAPLGLAPTIVDECIAQDFKLMDNFETGFRIKVPTELDGDGDQTRYTRYMSIVCIPGILLTIHTQPVPSLDGMARQLMTHVELHAPSTAALLHYILGTIFEEHLFKALEVRNQVTECEDALDNDIDIVEIQELLSLKKQVGRLNSTFQDLSIMVGFPPQVGSSAFRIQDQRKYYHDLADEVRQAIHGVDNLASRLRDMHQHYQLTSQDKTNRRLGTLTIIQPVFVPLTLIAGIYGMNFQYMPELQWGYGYGLILSLMTLIAIVELWGFKRGGWLE